MSSQRSQSPKIGNISMTLKDQQAISETSKADENLISWTHPIHGHIFQLKVLMLFLYRGVSKKYSFRLSTEVKEAWKFDDLVFEYTEGDTKVYRLLQAKHKIDETKKITVEKLLFQTKGNYSLIKYFHSYRSCKRDEYFKDSIIKDVTVCTNIDFDFNDLNKYNIQVEEIKEKDDILDVKSESKQSARYKFKSNIIPLLKTQLQNLKHNFAHTIRDDEIEDFLQHLVFAVNQPNEEELGDIVKKEIGKELDSITTENAYNKFFVKMLDWMKDKSRFMSYSEGKNLFDEMNKGTFLWYNIQDPTRSFTGRREKLKEMHKILQERTNSILCICGLGGVGKSELVKKYISEYSHNHDNKIVWINAVSYETLVDSFNKLACDKLDISTKNVDGQNKQIDALVEQVYQYFSKSKSLFIFDNAEIYCNDDRCNSGINSFLPTLPSDCIKPHIIITSRNQQWPENIKQMVLNGFTRDEAETFVLNYLDLKLDEHKENVQKLTEQLHFLPLALHQAVAYIKVQNDEFSLLEKNYQVSDYLNSFSEKTKELMSYQLPSECDNKYSKTVFSTWNITFNNLKDTENGRYALQILNILAYLLPDNIPIELVSSIYNNDEKLVPAISLLKQYSLISIHHRVLSIHRLVQQVTRLKLAENNKKERVLMKISRRILKNETMVNSKNVDHFLSIWMYMKKHTCILKEFNFVIAIIARVLMLSGRSKESYTISTENKKLLNQLSSSDKETQYLKSGAEVDIANALFGQGKYREALIKYEKIYESIKHLPHIDLTFDLKRNIASTLDRLGQNSEAFEKYKDLLADCQALLGKDHCESLLTKRAMIDRLIDAGKYDEALSEHEEIHEKLKSILGRDHMETLRSKSLIANLLKRMKKYKEATRLYEQVYKSQINTLVENHPDILETRGAMAEALSLQGNFDAALKIFREVYEITRKKFDKYDGKIIFLLGAIANTLNSQGKHDEAVETLQQVLEVERNRYGFHHHYVAETLQFRASILLTQGNDDRTLEAFEELLQYQIVLFGKNSYETLQARVVIIKILEKQKKYDIALEQYLEVYEIRKISLGENDPTTIMAKHNIGVIYSLMNEFDKALNILTEVYKTQEQTLGRQHQICIKMRHQISEIRKAQIIDKNKIKNPIEAIQKDNLDELKRLLEEGADVNSEDQNKYTLLHHAVNSNQPKTIKFLLNKGADVIRVTNKGNSPLHIATLKGYLEIVNDLLSHVRQGQLKKFIDAKTTKTGSAALHVASKCGFVEIVMQLLSRGATYNLKNIDGQSPLDLTTNKQIKKLLTKVEKMFEYAKSGQKDLFDTLKQCSIDEYLVLSETRNIEGYNLLQVAVLNNHKELVKSIQGLRSNHFRSVYLYASKLDHIGLNFDALFEMNNTLDQAHSLIEAFQTKKYGIFNPNLCTIEDILQLLKSDQKFKFTELAKSVIEFHVILLRKAIDTAKLLEAAKLNNFSTVKELVSKDADVNGRDDSGWTVLHHAVDVSNEKMVKTLLGRGAKAHSTTSSGYNTPLHIAANKGNDAIVKLLLKNNSGGKFVNAKTAVKESTALHVAAKKGRIDVVKILLAHGADWTIKNKDGHTAEALTVIEEIKALFKCKKADN